MTASDDARQAIAEHWSRLLDREGALTEADQTLAVVMPDGRTIAQHLDDGAVAERLLLSFVDGTAYRDAEGIVHLPGLEVSGVDLLDRLEADR